jgi:hypothetical protein
VALRGIWFALPWGRSQTDPSFRGNPRVIENAKPMKKVVMILGLLMTVDLGCHQLSALARPQELMANASSDLLCYVQRQNGQILDLKQLCEGHRTTWAHLSAVDQQFLQDYQTMLSNRYGRSQMQQNAEETIQRARATCANIQNGMSPNLAAIDQPEVDATVINDLALKHYCTELDD